MQNITFALPEESLRRVSQMAAERQMTLSALLAQIVTEFVEKEDRYHAASERQIALLAQGFDLGTQGEASWTRDELHDRPPAP